MGKAKPKYELPPGRLWPNTPSGAPLAIEVFGATGEYMSGKTLLGLSIAPGVHPAGHAFEGQPRTLLLDFEKSAGTYGGTGCCRIDVPAKLQEKFGQKAYQPIDVFQWFLELIGEIQPGQFDVIAADPVTDVESGQVAFIRKNHDAYGLTLNQITKGGGLLWGAVKDDWKQRLLQIGAKCQCFFFTSHLRQVWAGNTAVIGKREPKGKETLMELASLYLWLERKADKDGNVAPVPAATVLKQRLSDTLIKDGQLEIIELMPPRLPQATVAAIRQYIAAPPDYHKLKADEKVVEEEFSEAEKARLALATAEAQKETVEGQLAVLGRQKELRELARQEAPRTSPASDQSSQRKADKEAAEAAQAKAEADAALAKQQAEGGRLMETNDGVRNAEYRPTQEQIDRVRDLCKAIGMLPAVFQDQFLSKAGVTKVSDLSRKVCGFLIRTLEKECAKRKNLPTGPGNSEIPF